MKNVSIPLFDVMEMILDGYLSSSLTDCVGRLSTHDIQEFLDHRILPAAMESWAGGTLSDDEMAAYLESVRTELQDWSDDAFGPVELDFYLEVIAHYKALSNDSATPLITRTESEGVVAYSSATTHKNATVPSSASLEDHKRAIERLLPGELGIC